MSAFEHIGFSGFFERQHAPMVRLAWQITGSRETAEDLVQDAFIKIAPRFDGLESPEPYLRKIVVNGCMSWHRRRRLERERAPRYDDSVPFEGRELHDVLMRLDLRYRTALVLRFHLDLDHAEIGRAMGVTTGSARSLVFRAVQHVRRELGVEPPTGGDEAG